MCVCPMVPRGGCNADMLSTVRIMFRGLTKTPFEPRLSIYWNIGMCMVRSHHWASDLNRRDLWDSCLIRCDRTGLNWMDGMQLAGTMWCL